MQVKWHGDKKFGGMGRSTRRQEEEEEEEEEEACFLVCACENKRLLSCAKQRAASSPTF